MGCLDSLVMIRCLLVERMKAVGACEPNRWMLEALEGSIWPISTFNSIQDARAGCADAAVLV